MKPQGEDCLDTVLYKLLTRDKQARLFFIDNTRLIDEACSSLQGAVFDVFSTVLTFTCILHGIITNAKRVSVRLETSEPSAFMVIGADANGDVQGYVSDELAGRPYSSLKEMAGNNGCIKIVYDNGAGAVFTGIVEIKEDDIAQNLSRYFLQSEQTESVFRYFRKRDASGVCMSRGVFVQALPFANSTLIPQWTARLEKEKAVIADCQRPADTVPEVVFTDAAAAEQWAIRLRCSCDRQTVLFMLMGLGVRELEWTIDDNQDIEIRCGKCGQRYGFGPDEIQSLINMIGKQS